MKDLAKAKVKAHGEEKGRQGLQTKSTTHPGHCPKGEGCELEASADPRSSNQNRCENKQRAKQDEYDEQRATRNKPKE